MREKSVTEQRYDAVLGVISEGRTVMEVASQWGVSRRTRHRRKEIWKRWERGGPMELWQMDVVGGFLLADGTSAKALTGIDDHSRFCVSARLMPRERTQLVCDGFLAALRVHGVPQQVLTD